MIIVLILSISVLVYMTLGYPLILALFSLFFAKQVAKKEIYPQVSLIISAYNEEKVIRSKIENALKLAYPKDKLEIIVASESTDGTNGITQAYCELGIILYNYDKREGKRATLYRTVPKAKGEIIIFSDANAMYKEDAITKLVRNFADPRIGCVSGRLKYINPKDSGAGGGENTYWEYEYYLKKWASSTFHLAGSVNGSILAIRKELYDPIDRYRGDDFEIANRIEIKGYGVIMEPEALSYEEVSETAKQEFRRKVRLVTWNLKSTLLLLAEALKKNKLFTVFLLFSHRLLRYTAPVWLMLLFLSSAFLLESGLKYVFFAQVLFYLLALLGLILERSNYKVRTVFLLPFYFCLVNYAIFLALIKNIFGQTEMLWEKAR